MSGIIIAALIVGVVGFLVAIFLSVAGKAFFVPVDEKEVAITDALPEQTVVVAVIPDVQLVLRL